MSCKAAIRQTGDIAIVDLSGRIVLGDGSGLVRNTIKDLISRGTRSVLLNLGGVSYMDSAGLGELVGAYVSVTSAGGKIKLVNAQGQGLRSSHDHQALYGFRELPGRDLRNPKLRRSGHRLRSRERIARKRARQAKPPAPP